MTGTLTVSGLHAGYGQSRVLQGVAFNLAPGQILAVLGRTGSGRKPVAGTHHPTRHSDLYSYNALTHRHAPEVRALALEASGVEADFHFVPHSGPFARGIHVTVQAVAREPLSSHELVNALREYYDQSVFVRVTGEAPRVETDADGRGPALLDFLKAHGVLATGLIGLRFVTHLDVDAAGIDHAIATVRRFFVEAPVAPVGAGRTGPY